VVFERAGGECTPAAVAHRSFQVHTCGHLDRGEYELSDSSRIPSMPRS
jgi:hypothetical protein